MKNKNSTKTNAIIWIIMIIIIVLAYHWITSDSSSNSSNSIHTCDFCGQSESCKRYEVTYLTEYNKDGTIKKEYKSVYIGDRCISKARNSGQYANIE